MIKPQGRRGEVVVELFTSFPERFEDRRRVQALDARGDRRALEVEDFWAHKGRMVLKFAGIDSISDAETLSGSEIQIPAAQREKLPEGTAYVSDLVGCVVEAREEGSAARAIGSVADVTLGAGEAPLLVIRDGKKEYLVPFAEEYVERMDVAGKRIALRVPRGMLELDAPLSREEKEIQQRKN